MSTIITFFVLAAVGALLWWLLRDALPFSAGRRGRKCPVCGSGRTRRWVDHWRCSACGAEFKRHAGWHVHEPTPGAVSLILLALVGVLAFALSDMILGWQTVGTARASLMAAAAAAGIAASVFSFFRHRNQVGRN